LIKPKNLGIYEILKFTYAVKQTPSPLAELHGLFGNLTIEKYGKNAEKMPKQSENSTFISIHIKANKILHSKKQISLNFMNYFKSYTLFKI